MSINSISINTPPVGNLQDYQSRRESLRSEFQQLGSDLQTGNLTQAQNDFAKFSTDLDAIKGYSATAASQALTALNQALQSGNVSTAQQDYSAIVQSAPQGQMQVHHHHHHGNGTQSPNSSDAVGQLGQAFNRLGQDLQAGNPADAQQTYSVILQQLQQSGIVTSNSAPVNGNSINVSA